MSYPNPTPAVYSRYGAPMGRIGGPLPAPSQLGKLTLRRIRINGGGYDDGGAYWGLGQPLYWCASECGEFNQYFRAASRDAAKAIVFAMIGDRARFYR